MSNVNPIPFWGKTKPTRRYIYGYSLSFRVSDGKLFYNVTMTTKESKTKLFDFEVKSKEQLDRLLKAESLDEIRSIEVVN